VALKIRYEPPKPSAEEDAKNYLRKLTKATNRPIIPSQDDALVPGACQWCDEALWQNAWSGRPFLCPLHEAEQEKQRVINLRNAKLLTKRTKMEVKKMKLEDIKTNGKYQGKKKKWSEKKAAAKLQNNRIEF